MAVALLPLAAGDELALEGSRCASSVIVRMPIPSGHKVALCRLPAGSTVVKYGQPVGTVTHDIEAGEHVHIHNVISARAA